MKAATTFRPRCCSLKPYPPDLLTVPACKKCNGSFQKDDEYTAAVLTKDFRAARNETALSRLAAMKRNLERPQSARFAAYLRGQQTPSIILGANGQPLGGKIAAD